MDLECTCVGKIVERSTYSNTSLQKILKKNTPKCVPISLPVGTESSDLPQETFKDGIQFFFGVDQSSRV